MNLLQSNNTILQISGAKRDGNWQRTQA